MSIDFERVSEICAFDTFGISSWLFEVAASFQVETANITHVGDVLAHAFIQKRSLFWLLLGFEVSWPSSWGL